MSSWRRCSRNRSRTAAARAEYARGETVSHDKEKDKEIDILEDSISSYQKLYDMAIEHISSHWDTLYQDLMNWNYTYGSVTNDEISKAWEGASAAVNQYGSYLNAVLETQKRLSEATMNTIVGETGSGTASTIVSKMKANSARWWDVKDNTDALADLEADQQSLASQLRDALPGMNIERINGVWYINGEELYKSKYAKYHTGGFAGETGSLKDNEILAKLEKGETVLTTKMWDNLTATLDRMNHYSALVGDLPLSVRQAALDETLKRVSGGTVTTVTNVTNSSQPIEVRMGDITVYAPSGDGKIIADKVREITYDNVDQIARYLKLRL